MTSLFAFCHSIPFSALPARCLFLSLICSMKALCIVGFFWGGGRGTVYVTLQCGSGGGALLVVCLVAPLPPAHLPPPFPSTNTSRLQQLLSRCSPSSGCQIPNRPPDSSLTSLVTAGFGSKERVYAPQDVCAR